MSVDRDRKNESVEVIICDVHVQVRQGANNQTSLTAGNIIPWEQLYYSTEALKEEKKPSDLQHKWITFPICDYKTG